MQLFQGVLRVNASDKTQAYATLKGLSADIFIKASPLPAISDARVSMLAQPTHEVAVHQPQLAAASFLV